MGIFTSICSRFKVTRPVRLPYSVQMRLWFPILVFCSMFSLASCNSLTYHLALPAPQQLAEQSISPDTGGHQGYATDGISHFIFDTRRILTRADDASWHITRVNDTPFAGLSGYNHLGDGDYFDQKLYVPAENFVSCSEHSNPAILVFDSTTLERTRVIELAQGQEVSAVVVRPAARQLWVSSYCDGSQVWIYDIDDIDWVHLERTVRLSPAVPGIQGLAYRDDFFFLAQNAGTIRRMYLDGVSAPVYQTSSPGAHEGIDYSQGELRWLIDEGVGEQKVHYLVPANTN